MAALGGRHLRPFMDLHRPDQMIGRCAGVSALNGHKVDRRVLPSSVDLEIEFEPVAFVDSLKTRTLNRADVYEGIFLAVVARDEAEAFHRIEELDRAGGLLARQLALGRLRRRRDDVTDDLQIGRGDLAPTIDQVELQFLALGKALEPGALDLADVDEDVLTTVVTLDEAETLLRVEELDLALACADDLCRHAAAPRGTAIAATTEATAPAAAAKTAAATAATAAIIGETASAAAEPVTAAKLRRSPILERIEGFFAESIPLVAPPAATASIVTHLTNVPSLRPLLASGVMDEYTPND